jgi:hypothetical protein
MSNRFFHTCSVLKPAPYGCVFNTRNLGQFRNRNLASVKFNDVIIFFVSALSLSISPSAVFRAVSTVVVYAINGVFAAWAFTHVGKKRFKAVSPSIAHGYASTSVSRVRAHAFYVAPAYHVRPDTVFARVAHPVFYAFRFIVFFSKAAARCANPSNQTAGRNSFFCSAIAFAVKVCGSVTIFGSANYEQSAKAFAAVVDKAHFVTSKSHHRGRRGKRGVIRSFGSYPTPAECYSTENLYRRESV